MKWLLTLGMLSFAFTAGATVISPSSMEVNYSFTSEFQTSKDKQIEDLVELQASYLFGYMQNPEIVAEWDLNKRIYGIGAPAWSPKVKILENTEEDGVRTIRYRAEGKMLLIKSVAQKLIKDGHWDVTLPYNLDKFYDKDCTDKDFPGRGDFWYFYDPFREGCEDLRAPDLAKKVSISIKAIPNVPEDLPANLDELRVDNGHDLFQITTVNGFDEGSRKRNDDGRVNYEKMNEWFVKKGFTDTFISKYKERPIHQFDKTVTRADGRRIHIRFTRLLAVTELDGNRNVTFAKFFEGALKDSDVIVYEGHSGLGTNLDFEHLEERAGIKKSDIDASKRQLYLFDSCSSYSYYLAMFDGLKDPGKLNVLTNGIESEFGYEVPETKHLYDILMDVDNNSYTWMEIIKALEKPFRGTTFMMNVYLND